MNRSTLLLTAALISVPALAAEKRTLPKDLPVYGDLKPVKAPTVKQVTLDNGMTVWLAPSSGFPKVAFAVAVRGGYTGDPTDRPGLADLLGATVTQGTSHRTAKQLAEEIAATGGDLNADATSDSIVIETSVLSGKADTALKLLADMTQNAAFADAEVEIAKSNLMSTVEANEEIGRASCRE